MSERGENVREDVILSGSWMRLTLSRRKKITNVELAFVVSDPLRTSKTLFNKRNTSSVVFISMLIQSMQKHDPLVTLLL